MAVDYRKTKNMTTANGEYTMGAAGVGGETCPNCDDVGWYAWPIQGSLYGEVEQVQCEWCYVNANSIFRRSGVADDDAASPNDLKITHDSGN